MIFTFPEKTIIRMVGKSSEDCSRIISEGQPSPSFNNYGDASSRRLNLGQYGQRLAVDVEIHDFFCHFFMLTNQNILGRIISILAEL